MSEYHFCILPGERRGEDRIVPRSLVEIRPCKPTEVKHGHHRSVHQQFDNFKVQVGNEPERVYQFIVPCSFDPEWTSLDAFASYCDAQLCVSDDIGSDDRTMGRSVIRNWVALTDGTVYTSRHHGEFVMTEKLPYVVDPEYLDLVMNEIRQNQAPRRECLRA